MLPDLDWFRGPGDSISSSGINAAVALMEKAITPSISVVLAFLEKRSRTLLLVLLSVLLAALYPCTVQGFQLTESPEGKNSSLFVPYQQGFVGRIGDPFTTYTRTRAAAEGAEGSDDIPRMYEPPPTARE